MNGNGLKPGIIPLPLIHGLKTVVSCDSYMGIYTTFLVAKNSSEK